MIYNKALAIGFLMIMALSVPGQAQQKTYVTSRLTGAAPVIDGTCDEAVWEAVPWEGGFLQHEPYDGREPSQPTFFKVLYDDQALYVAIHAVDSSTGEIDRRMTRRDGMDGDFVGIHLDSYFDRRTAFAFMVSAAGVKSDYIISNDRNEDYTWDPVWFVKTSFDSTGWYAEMKIPYTQVRFAKSDDYRWGMNVGRHLLRNQEVTLWQHIPQDAPGWVSQFGDLEGLKNIKPAREVELLPYVMGKMDIYEKEDGNPYADGTDLGVNAGIDGKIAVTNDLTMNFTINPDFGQVEADPSVVNLSAFETYYSEKRPFFVEGKNIYNYYLTGGDGGMSFDNLFYSRRIGRTPRYCPEINDGEWMKMPENTTILSAFKLSGKTRKGWSVGIMESVTTAEKACINAEGEERKEIVEPWTNFFNARVQKDFSQGQTIVGGMLTSTHRFINDSTLESLPGSAYTGGLDFTRYWNDRTYFLRLKGVFSHVSGTTEAITELQQSPVHYFQRPDAGHLRLDTTLTNLAGHGGTMEFGKQGKGHWRYVAWLTWRSPGLELNDMGYLRQGDMIQQVTWASYRIWEPFSIFRSLNVNFNQWSGWDFGGNYVYSGTNVNMDSQFKNFWAISPGVEWEGTWIDRYSLRGGPAFKIPGRMSLWGFAETDSRKRLSVGAGVVYAKRNPDHSEYTRMQANVTYRPLKSLELMIGPRYEFGYDNLQYVTTAGETQQQVYVLGHIMQHTVSANIRINFNITPDLTLQYWGQPFVSAGDYDAFKRASETMADVYARRFYLYDAAQIRFDEINDLYSIDENLDGQEDFTFSNPDFKVFEFRSNLVLRWEYVPGSTLYVVWSQGRSESEGEGNFRFMDDMSDIFEVKPRNIFLVKLSYRISV